VKRAEEVARGVALSTSREPWFDEALAASVAWFVSALAKRKVAARAHLPCLAGDAASA
jgi:hypothetical protein